MKKFNMFCLVLVVFVALTVMSFTFAAVETSEDDVIYEQSLEEACARVNGTNINDLIVDMNPNIAESIDPCVPSKFVATYVTLDSSFIDVLEGYFGITIV